MKKAKKTLFALASLAIINLSLTGCDCEKSSAETCKPKGVAVKTYTKADLYEKSGALNGEALKQAYYDMMNRFNYPIPAILKSDNFWVCDFLQADATKLGMGGVFWVNQKGSYGETGTKKYSGDFKGQNFGYLGHEIYLLPGQTLPEHTHFGGSETFGPKMEAWHIRYGSVRFFSEVTSEGAKLISELPESEKPWGYGQPWFKSKYYVDGKAGDVVTMDDPETWHFQQALSEGAIVSEYGTYHNHVTFSKPGMEFDNTKASK